MVDGSDLDLPVTRPAQSFPFFTAARNPNPSSDSTDISTPLWTEGGLILRTGVPLVVAAHQSSLGAVATTTRVTRALILVVYFDHML
jgi:hypothetical protein